MYVSISRWCHIYSLKLPLFNVIHTLRGIILSGLQKLWSNIPLVTSCEEAVLLRFVRFAFTCETGRN